MEDFLQIVKERNIDMDYRMTAMFSQIKNLGLSKQIKAIDTLKNKYPVGDAETGRAIYGQAKKD